MGSSENRTSQQGSYLEAGNYFLLLFRYHFGIVLLCLHKKGVVSSVTVLVFPLLKRERDSQGRNQDSLIERKGYRTQDFPLVPLYQNFKSAFLVTSLWKSSIFLVIFYEEKQFTWKK